MTVEKTYPLTSIEQKIRTNDMWGGSHKRDEYETIIARADGTIQRTTVLFAPVSIKWFDELITNAVDHFVRTAKVTKIFATFADDGIIAMENDGPSVPIEYHNDAKMYVPELIFGKAHQGSNTNKDPNAVTGGCNGLGVKLATFQSREFIIDIKDPERKKVYHSIWRDYSRKRTPPQIKAYSGKSGMTKITFVPDYDNCAGGAETPYAGDFTGLQNMARFRAYIAHLYCSYIATIGLAKKAPKMTFNNEAIMSAKLFETKQSLWNGIISPEKELFKNMKLHPIQVLIMPPQHETIICINGLAVQRSTLSNSLKSQICKGVQAIVEKKLKTANVRFNQNMVLDKISLIIIAAIPFGGIAQDSQSKTETNIAHGISPNYKIPDTAVRKIAKLISEDVLDEVLVRSEAADKKSKDSDVSYGPSKYQPAQVRGKDATLVLSEGDSALGQVRKAVNSFDRKVKKYFGLLSTGGVIVNALQQTNLYKTKDGKTILKQKSMLEKNEFFKNLMIILGVNATHHAEPPRSMNYGRIICCFDQDLDGIGKIMSLFLCAIRTLWPWMFERKMIWFYETPIIRAYPKKSSSKVLAFYNDYEYRKWSDAQNRHGAGQSSNAAYRIKYYKGLGSHNMTETIQMFKSLEDRTTKSAHLFRFDLDNEAHKVFLRFFDKDTAVRKDELRRENTGISPDELLKRRAKNAVNCTSHLRNEYFEYAKDDLERKLSHVIDGMTQSSRKVLNGALETFTSMSMQKKVSQLAGIISSTQVYHHGETSLENCIKGFVQIWAGGTQLPLFIGEGNFGSRFSGIKESAAARYPSVSLNKRLTDLLFPAEDYYLLEFVFDEGRRCEPKYFVPILPMAILESTRMPSVGWKNEKWARDVFFVIKYIRMTLDLQRSPSAAVLPPCKWLWKGSIVNCGRYELSIGTYEHVNDKCIRVTELPLGRYNNSYVEDLRKKPYIRRVLDESDFAKKNEVSIYVHLTEPIEDNEVISKLLLQESLHKELNMYGTKMEVLEMREYRDIIDYWFPIRLQLYARRITRQIAICEANIDYYTEIIKYIDLSKDYPNRKIAAIEADLEKRKIIKINKGLLMSPGFTPVKEFVKKVRSGSYDYLLDLTDRKKSTEGKKAFKDKLAEQRALLAKLKKSTPVDLFNEELDAVEKIIQAGRENLFAGEKKNWNFSE